MSKESRNKLFSVATHPDFPVIQITLRDLTACARTDVRQNIVRAMLGAVKQVTDSHPAAAKETVHD